MKVLSVIVVLVLVVMMCMVALAMDTDLPPVMLTATVTMQTPDSGVLPFFATNTAAYATANSETINTPPVMQTQEADGPMMTPVRVVTPTAEDRVEMGRFQVRMTRIMRDLLAVLRE